MGLVVLLAFAARAQASRSRPPAPAPQGLAAAKPHGGALAGDELIEILVEGAPDVSGTFRIAADGRIDLPYLGRLQVAGRTPVEVEETIASALERAARRGRPAVTVSRVAPANLPAKRR